MTDRSSPAGHEQAEKLKAAREWLERSDQVSRLSKAAGVQPGPLGKLFRDAVEHVRFLLAVLPPVEPPQKGALQRIRELTAVVEVGSGLAATHGNTLLEIHRIAVESIESANGATADPIDPSLLAEYRRHEYERHLAVSVAPEPPQKELLVAFQALTDRAERHGLCVVNARAAIAKAETSALSQPDAGWRDIATAPTGDSDADLETRRRIVGCWKHKSYGWIWGPATYHPDKHDKRGGYWIVSGGEPTHWRLMDLPADITETGK